MKYFFIYFRQKKKRKQSTNHGIPREKMRLKLNLMSLINLWDSISARNTMEKDA